VPTRPGATARRRRPVAAFLLIDTMIALFVATLVMLGACSLVVSGAAAADAARQNNAAYNCGRQVIENLRLRRAERPLADGAYPDVTVFGPVPQLAYLRGDGGSNPATASMNVSTWRGSVKQVTVTVTWRAGANAGRVRTRTTTALIGPKGVAL
jgi:Tfp pilus assembly protein PilV